MNGNQLKVPHKPTDPPDHIPFFHPLSRRFHVILVLMGGCFSLAYTRSNLGMTMTCMVNATAVFLQQNAYEANATIPVGSGVEKLKQDGRCVAALNDLSYTPQLPINNYGGDIVWDTRVQNVLFTGTFFGSLLSTLPAGYLADRTSPSNVLMCASAIFAVMSATFPYVATHFDYWAVFVSRVLMGIGEGLIFPSVNAMIARWIPNHEKGQAASLFTIGAQLSGAVGVPISASFCASRFKWPGVFYFSSIFAIVWAIIFRTTTTNSPAKSRCMTKRERAYLEYALENHRTPTNAKHKIPWSQMLRSRQLLTLLYVSFCFNVLMTIMHTYMPTFFKEVLFLKMIDNGIFSALPHVGQMVTKLIWSVGIDSLKRRKIISNTAGCRISQSVACITGSLMLVLIAKYADCSQPRLALGLFVILGAGLGPATSGFYTSMITLAPAYTGTLSSMTMMVGFVGMIATPVLVNMFRVYGTADEWSRIFVFTAVLVLSSGVFFAFNASGEIQPWGRRPQPAQIAANSKEPNVETAEGVLLPNEADEEQREEDEANAKILDSVVETAAA